MSAADDRDSLPLPDYDHLALGSVISRIRSLDRQGVGSLLQYERGHGNRLPVTQALQERLDELEAGAQPTSGSAGGLAPEAAPPPASPRTVDQTTEAPAINPPSHGDPTNPAQPR